MRTLFFEDLLMTVKAEPKSEDVGKGFEFGLVWRQKEQGKRFELTKWQAGRVVVTNYDPNALSQREKQELNDKIRKYVPKDFVFLRHTERQTGGRMAHNRGNQTEELFGDHQFHSHFHG